MIIVQTKIQSKDLEKESRYIESISNDKKSFLDLVNPNEEPKKATKATHDPLTKTISEEAS